MKRLNVMLRTVLALALLSVSAIGIADAGNTDGAASQTGGLPPGGDLTRVPLGEFAEDPESNIGARIANPYAGQSQATEQGRQLFIQMNCADCHGFDAKGGMGPDLTGKYWRYGGTPAAIYKSIYEGRPQGMPAWGRVLPPDSIWLLVAYIQSLGGSFPPQSYQASLQGDRPGEQVAPELGFEQELDGLAPAAQPQPRGTTVRQSGTSGR